MICVQLCPTCSYAAGALFCLFSVGTPRGDGNIPNIVKMLGRRHVPACTGAAADAALDSATPPDRGKIGGVRNALLAGRQERTTALM